MNHEAIAEAVKYALCVYGLLLIALIVRTNRLP